MEEKKEQNEQKKQAVASRFQGPIEYDPNIEDKVAEVRGLIMAFNALFSTGDCPIVDPQDITDLYFATRVLKDKFEELSKIFGYGKWEQKK
jgi:hypothetical protein